MCGPASGNFVKTTKIWNPLNLTGHIWSVDALAKSNSYLVILQINHDIVKTSLNMCLEFIFILLL